MARVRLESLALDEKWRPQIPLGLEAFPQGNVFDLVPEELTAAYQENPSSLATAYRKVAEADGTPPVTEATATGSVATNRPEQRLEPKAVGAAPVTDKPATKSARVASIQAAQTGNSTEAGDLIDITALHAAHSQRPGRANPAAPVFYYQPAPAVTLDANLVRDPGLARLSLDEKGNVTAAKVLRSTEQTRFDNEAADTLRRRRAKPGSGRDVEVSLTNVLSGKRAPLRLPTTTGTMTSG
ncbi:MAG: energy transducer TonB [Verrucomicrobiota bacterium]|nr:energy transducer TonB [Verrucomicrobiota bacterium]